MKIVSDQSCPVFVGDGSLERLQDFLVKKSKGFRIVLLHEKQAETLILPPLLDKVPVLAAAGRYVLDSTEPRKQLENLLPLWNAWSEDRLDRHTIVVLAGGGVLCDMGGLAASLFKRGMPFVNVPTTLLAMADASVGGKTAVDLGETKNLIGMFRRPMAVAVDPVFMETLPTSEYLSGMAEILKMQMIAERRFKPESIAPHFEKQAFSSDLMYFAVKEKARITRRDFQETGLRKTLNFGHTFGHAFESLALRREKPIPHGYAVAYGMACELFLSCLCCGFDHERFTQANRLIRQKYGIFEYTPEDIPALASYMQNDKKNQGERELKPVLLARYGSCRHDIPVSPRMTWKVLEDYPFENKKSK